MQCNAFFDMLGTFRIIAVRAFGREFVAADGTFVFFGDLASWARSWYRGRRHSCEWRAGEHVDYGLRSRAEVEGELAIVGCGVA